MSVSRRKREIRMALKMGLIVMTDLLCWMPIVILGILVQTERITMNPTSYAWIVAFVLPINSAINPFLYALGHILSNHYDRIQAEDEEREAIAETPV